MGKNTTGCLAKITGFPPKTAEEIHFCCHMLPPLGSLWNPQVGYSLLFPNILLAGKPTHSFHRRYTSILIHGGMDFPASYLSWLIPERDFLLDLSVGIFVGWIDPPNLRNVTSQLSCLGFPVDFNGYLELKQHLPHPMNQGWLVFFFAICHLVSSRLCFLCDVYEAQTVMKIPAGYKLFFKPTVLP